MDSYKEMWVDAHALQSLAKHKMYEAGGSAFWCMPAVQDQERLDKQSISYDQLLELCASHWSEERKQGEWLLWPATLYTYTEAGQPDFRNQRLLSGHPTLLTWWYAIFEALKKNDSVRVRSLMKAALTATVHLKQVKDIHEAARHAIEAAATYKSHNVAMGETFVNWLLRFRLCHSQLLRRQATYKEHFQHAQSLHLLQDGKLVALPGITAACFCPEHLSYICLKS